MKSRDVLAVFNRGRISRHAIARVDVGRVALSAEVQINWRSKPLGYMTLRPGLKMVGEAPGDGADIPFLFRAPDDVARLELTPGVLRIWDDGDTLVTRNAVTATVTNGTFTSDVTGWTDDDQAGAASIWQVGGVMQLLGSGTTEARRTQAITITETGTAHALRIVISRGPVYLRIGTTSGDDDVVRQAVLRTGTHSIAFTPGAATIYVQFASPLKYEVLVDSVAFEGGGVMTLPTPWPDAATCKLVRWYQSGDIIYCACDGYRQKQIERRANNSWSIIDYLADDGPFLVENLSNVTLTPSGITSSITLTASGQLFQSGHVGALFSLTSAGQTVAASASAGGTFTDPIRVSGVENGRVFWVQITGTWTGSINLQRSVGAPGDWVDVDAYTTNTGETYDDGFDNSLIYYRLGFKSGNHTSGTAELLLDYAAGSITGTARVYSVSSPTQALAYVVNDLGGTAATLNWREGAWSDVNGWPSAVAIAEGRMWWFGKGYTDGSVSDAYTLFDPDFDGDAGPIRRRVGEGPIDRINWALPLQRLIAGGDSAEHSIRSNSFDEPITPSNYNSKRPSTKGSGQVPAVEVDGRGYFVSKTGRALYELDYIAEKYDYGASRATVLVPEIGDDGFVRLAVAVEPEVRVYCVRGDGTVAVLLRDAREDILCWEEIETHGIVEDAVILPGTNEDRVFFRVRRTINGSTVRFCEEMVREEQCRGGADSRLADCHITGSGSASTITGLSHLEGEAVVVWADGADKGTFTVSGGEIDLGETVSQWCVGLGYTGQWKSAKLAGQTAMGLSLSQRSRINKLGLILTDTHYQGLQYGPDFDTLDDLPLVQDGAVTAADTVWEAFEGDMIEFPGDWDQDSRICLQAAAPRPATVLAVVANVDRQDAD